MYKLTQARCASAADMMAIVLREHDYSAVVSLSRQVSGGGAARLAGDMAAIDDVSDRARKLVR